MRPTIGYGRMVGGGTVHFTANYWRFHEIDFVERSRKGAVPGTGFDDWPITYADLEPYYTKAEWELGVSGQAVAAPHQVHRRAHRARGPEAGLDGLPLADGDPLPAVPGPLTLRALRVLRGVRLRDAGEEQHARERDPGRRAHRSVRDPPRELHPPDRGGPRRARDRRRLLRPRGKGASAAGPRRRGLRQRRRDAAAPAPVHLEPVSRRARQLERRLRGRAVRARNKRISRRPRLAHHS